MLICSHRNYTPVSNDRKIDFKEPLEILVGLDAALKHEKLKYEKAPIATDVLPDYEMAVSVRAGRELRLV